MVCHLLDEVDMLALLHDAALLHHQDVVGIHDRAAAHTPHTQRNICISSGIRLVFCESGMGPMLPGLT
jgi:hypothetical protein